MAILFRTISDLTIDGMEARLTVYRGGDRLKVEIEPYNSATTTAYTGALQAAVTYNGVSRTFAASPFTEKVSAMFDYSADVRKLTLAASAVSYRGTSAESCTITWKGDGTIAAPEVEISYFSGLMYGSASRIEWTADGGSIPDGYTVNTVGVWFHYAEASKVAPDYTRTAVVSGRTSVMAFEHTISPLEANNVVFYRIAVALYENPGDADEDYVAYAEIDSPAYVCSGDDVYTLAPHSLRYPSTVAKGRAFTIRWELLDAATSTAGLELQYSYNGRNVWYDVCTLTDVSLRSYSYTVAADSTWTSVAFRIRSYSTRSKYETSNYSYGKWSAVGGSNIYVGRDGTPVPASAVQVGTSAASAAVSVG